MSSKHLSMRSYAQTRKARGLTGTSHVAVHHAIAAGRLSKCLVRDAEGKVIGILPDVADAEWDANTDALAGGAGPEPGAPRQRELIPSAPETPRPGAGPNGEPSNAAATTRIKFAQAARVEYAALLEQLDYEERIGRLVPIAAIRAAEFELARMLAGALDQLVEDLSATCIKLPNQRAARPRIKQAVDAMRAKLQKALADGAKPR